MKNKKLNILCIFVISLIIGLVFLGLFYLDDTDTTCPRCISRHCDHFGIIVTMVGDISVPVTVCNKWVCDEYSYCK